MHRKNVGEAAISRTAPMTAPTTFDFQDGHGSVSAHRHSNGGGWVKDGVIVPGKVYVGPHAYVVGGTFEGGTFRGGTFWGGTFEGGTFEGGTFGGGTFRGGTFRGGTFRGGTFRGGTFEGGTFRGGTFWAGTFRGGTFEGGTFGGGTFRGGTFRGGTFRGGTFEGGTFRGGTFEGGTFGGGTFWGGTFWGGTLIKQSGDCATFGPVGSRDATLTLCRTDTPAGHQFVTGCFVGNYAQLKAQCLATHGKDSKHYANYGAAATALWRIVMGEEKP